MKRILSLIAAALAGALVTALVFMMVVPVLAQGQVGSQGALTPVGNGSGTGRIARNGMGQGRAGRYAMNNGMATNGSLIATAATELGISQQELVARLTTSGKSIADELQAAGIDPQVVAEKFVASRADRLSAAVEAGRITADQAEAQLTIARSMTVARLIQPFTPLGPGGIRPDNAPVSPDQCMPQAGNGQNGHGFGCGAGR